MRRMRRGRRSGKWIEEIFGWSKTVGELYRLKVRGLEKVRTVFTLALAAYNIVWLAKLLATTPEICLDAGK